jgi:hypothetical protein
MDPTRQHTETEEALLVGEHDPACHQSRILHLINENKDENQCFQLADSSAA